MGDPATTEGYAELRAELGKPVRDVLDSHEAGGYFSCPGNAAGPMITFQNVKTGLFLRVRNSGPIMNQTVTTGSTFTVWLMF